MMKITLLFVGTFALLATAASGLSVTPAPRSPVTPAPLPQPSCLDLQQGIPYDLSDIFNILTKDLGKSGLLPLFESILQNVLHLDPKNIPCEAFIDLELANTNIANISINHLAVQNYLNIDNIGQINATAPQTLTMAPAFTVNDLWLNGTVSLESGLTPLHLLDMAISIGINVESLTLGASIKVCFDSEAYSFQSLVGDIVQAMSLPSDQRVAFVAKTLLTGVTSVEVEGLNVNLNMKQFYLVNEKNERTWDIDLSQDLKDSIHDLVAQLADSDLIKDELNKVLNKFFAPSEVLQRRKLSFAELEMPSILMQGIVQEQLSNAASASKMFNFKCEK